MVDSLKSVPIKHDLAYEGHTHSSCYLDYVPLYLGQWVRRIPQFAQLLARRHSVHTVIRAHSIADQVPKDTPSADSNLGFAIAPETANLGNFDQAVKSDPSSQTSPICWMTFLSRPSQEPRVSSNHQAKRTSLRACDNCLQHCCDTDVRISDGIFLTKVWSPIS